MRNTLKRNEVEKLLVITRLGTQAELQSRIDCTKEHLSVMMCKDRISPRFSKLIVELYPNKMLKILPTSVYHAIAGTSKDTDTQRSRQYLSVGALMKRLKDEHDITVGYKKMAIIVREARKKV